MWLDLFLQEFSLALILFDRFVHFGGGPLLDVPALLHALVFDDDKYSLEDSKT